VLSEQSSHCWNHLKVTGFVVLWVVLSCNVVVGCQRFGYRAAFVFKVEIIV
jgi:hypothetical protein